MGDDDWDDFPEDIQQEFAVACAAKELHVGMRIKYNHPLMVSGTRAAAREAVIEKILPDDEYPLLLDTRDCLDTLDYIKAYDVSSRTWWKTMIAIEDCKLVRTSTPPCKN